MTNGEYQNHVAYFVVVVQREVSRSAARNDQFAHVLLGWAPDERMIPECLHGFGNQLGGRQCKGRFRFEKKVGKPFEVLERSPGVDQSRQGLASGLETTFPLARARM